MSLQLALPLDARAIAGILPHRAPFLFLDSVDSVIPGEEITGRKVVGEGEPWATGHFPGRPVFPGVLILEAFAQLSGVLFSLQRASDPAEVRPLLLAIDKAKFRRVVVPGDTLLLRVRVLQRREQAHRVRAEARVGDELAAEAELLLSQNGRAE